MQQRFLRLQLFGWGLFIISCSMPAEEVQEEYLILSCDLPQDTNGIYHYSFPANISHSYLAIDVQSTPLTRIYFSSPDSFCVYLHGFLLCYPIVNYSIYTRESDGTGKQFAYVDRSHVGTTLFIEGVTEDRWAASIMIKVEDDSQMMP